MDNELKIKVTTDGGATISQLEAKIKELRQEFKASKIGTVDFDISAKELKKTLEQKTVAMKAVQTENGKMMESYFKLGENLRRNTNPAFISFNQVIQDAPFGIRGVGNNIQFLTQQFTQLRSAGMTTKDILKGMMSNILTPMGGLMFAVSAGTSLLTMAMDGLAKETKQAKNEFEGLAEQMDRIRQMEFERGAISADQRRKDLQLQVDVAKRAKELLAEQTKARTEQVAQYDPQTGTLIGFTTVEIKGRVLSIKEIADANERIEKALKAQADFEREITQEQEKRERIKRPERYIRASGSNFFDDSGAQFRNQKYAFGLDERARQLEQQGKQYQMQQAEELAQIQNDAEERQFQRTEDRIKAVRNAYNSYLFDPLRAGFQSLSGEVMQTLFGSLDRLDDKFGRVGASIIRALQGVIAQMLAVAALSFALSFIPGAGSFGSNFLALSGLSGVMSGGGGTQRTALANASGRSLTRDNVLVVQVQGEIEDRVIHLANKNFIGRQKAAAM